MSYLIKPVGYKPLLDMKQTELGIKQIKEFFQQNLSSELRLRRVTAPLFVLKGMGINDDLSGTERPVSFPIKDLGDQQAEVVHSLAKWKRVTLADYQIEPGYGIYTDMNAIRADEELGNIHSLYVDQWDWERVITNEDRNVERMEVSEFFIRTDGVHVGIDTVAFFDLIISKSKSFPFGKRMDDFSFGIVQILDRKRDRTFRSVQVVIDTHPF